MMANSDTGDTGNTPITPGIRPIMIIYNVPLSGQMSPDYLGNFRRPGWRVGPVWLLWESWTKIDTLFVYCFARSRNMLDRGNICQIKQTFL